MEKYIYGSIRPVGMINEHMAAIPPLAFQGNITDKQLMPKKAQIPFITNQSTCTFVDGSGGLTVYIYNLSDDTWYNSTDPSDTV